jgi:hypothetical protein
MTCPAINGTFRSRPAFSFFAILDVAHYASGCKNTAALA